jgi:hypothetical protein
VSKQILCFLFGIILILISTPLAYSSVNVVYHNKNLAEEYLSILNGFIHSYIIIGILIFSIGFINTVRNKKRY